MALQGAEEAKLRVYCSSPIGGVYADITTALIQQHQQVCKLPTRCLTEGSDLAIVHPGHVTSGFALLIVSVWLHQDGQEETKLWVKAQRQPNMELPSKARDADDKESSSQVGSVCSTASHFSFWCHCLNCGLCKVEVLPVPAACGGAAQGDYVEAGMDHEVQLYLTTTPKAAAPTPPAVASVQALAGTPPPLAAGDKHRWPCRVLMALRDHVMTGGSSTCKDHSQLLM